MVSQIAEQLRMPGDVALRRRIDADLADVIRKVRMFWHVANQRRMIRHGANGQRERTAGSHQTRVLWVVGDVADDGAGRRRQFRMPGHVADGLGRDVAFRHVTGIVRMVGNVAEQFRMRRDETVRSGVAVIGAHQLRIVWMRLDVAEAERMVGHVAKRLRLRLVQRHEIRIFRMAGDVAPVVRMAWDGANRPSSCLGEFRMTKGRVVGMARIVTEEHRMPGDGADGQFVLIRVDDVVGLEIRVVRMFGDVALVGGMGRHVADRVLERPSQSRIAVLGVVRMADEIAQDARMGGQIDVADGLDLGWRAARRVFRIIRVFGQIAQQFRMRRDVADRLLLARRAS